LRIESAGMLRRLVVAIGVLALGACAARESPQPGPVARGSGTETRTSGAPSATLSDSANRQSSAPPAKAPDPKDAGSLVAGEVTPTTAEGVLAAVRQPGPSAVLVNVWATWCAPCREEFPDLMRLHQAYRERGLKLILVSADFDDQLPAVKRFLARQRVDFPTYLKTGDDMRFINTLSPRWTGALPATFIYDATGQLRYFSEGRVARTTLEEQVLKLIDRAANKASKEEKS